MKRLLLLGLLSCSYVAHAQRQSLYLDVFNSSTNHNVTTSNFQPENPNGLSNWGMGIGYERQILGASERPTRWSIIAELKLRNLGYNLKSELGSENENYTAHYSSASKLALLEAGIGAKYNIIDKRKWSVGAYVLARPQFVLVNKDFIKYDLLVSHNSRVVMASTPEKLQKIGFAGTLGANIMYGIGKRSALGLNASYTQGFVALMNFNHEQQIMNSNNNSINIIKGNVKTTSTSWDIGFRYRYTLK